MISTKPIQFWVLFSPGATGRTFGAKPPKQSPKPPQLETGHASRVLSIFYCQAPRTNPNPPRINAKPPCWKLSGDGSGSLWNLDSNRASLRKKTRLTEVIKKKRLTFAKRYVYWDIEMSKEVIFRLRRHWNSFMFENVAFWRLFENGIMKNTPLQLSKQPPSQLVGGEMSSMGPAGLYSVSPRTTIWTVKDALNCWKTSLNSTYANS